MTYLDRWMTGLNVTTVMVGVLVGVAFFTLLERKILGYIQLRKGPNKVGMGGLFQPFSDAVKLFTKENALPLKANYGVYVISPVGAFGLGLLVWVLVPMGNGGVTHSWGMLFFLAVTSLMVYLTMSSGWASNSSYALLGGLRAMAQTISYEVSLALILLFFMGLVGSLDLTQYAMNQKYVWFVGVGAPLTISWFISSLAETNRTPFDLAEGESELVSGFNVEYSGGGFALIFLAEYCSIMFMSMLLSGMSLGGFSWTWGFCGVFMGVVGLFIWVRGTMPRFRYDKLMGLTWKVFLPMVLGYLVFALGVEGGWSLWEL